MKGLLMLNEEIMDIKKEDKLKELDLYIQREKQKDWYAPW